MKVAGFAGCVGLLLVVAIADYLTVYEINLSTFYLGPVGLVAWFGGRKQGLWFALGAGIVWVMVDSLNGHPYTSPLYRYWSALMRIAGYLIVATLVSGLKQGLDQAARLAVEKEEAFQKLQNAMAELRRLEGTMQTVCAWTRKIKDGDEWLTLEEYLSRHLKNELTHGISPEGRKLFFPSLPPSQVEPPKR